MYLGPSEMNIVTCRRRRRRGIFLSWNQSHTMVWEKVCVGVNEDDDLDSSIQDQSIFILNDKFTTLNSILLVHQPMIVAGW